MTPCVCGSAYLHIGLHILKERNRRSPIPPRLSIYLDRPPHTSHDRATMNAFFHRLGERRGEQGEHILLQKS